MQAVDPTTLSSVTNRVNQSRCNSLYNRCPAFIQAAFTSLKEVFANRCFPVLIGLIATAPVLLSSKTQEIAAKTLQQISQIAPTKYLILASATAIVCLWTTKKYLLTSNTPSIDRIRYKPRLEGKEGKRTFEQENARAKKLAGIKQQLEDPSLTALKIEKSLRHHDIYGLEGPFCGLEYIPRRCGSQLRRTFRVLNCLNRCYITTKRQVI